ncbi:MAG: hypothetical protein U5L06_13630 [Rhodovibrio sp.]|nr:hypothetical protein [Rhodovibrio sp.]
MKTPDARQRRACRRAARAAGAGLFAILAALPVRGEVEVDGTLVKITKADCLRLVKHRPDPGVTYQPGVDVHGDPVADADLYDRPRIELPERLQIPIEVDLDDRYDLPGDDSFKGDVQVGTVEVDLETGRATFNGQPLTSAAEAALRARCRKVLAGGREAE